MSESKHFDLPAIFPGEHIYTQIAAISERYPSFKFNTGREVVYHEVHLDRASAEKRAEVRLSLAKLIYTELEAPSFLSESPEMPYSVEVFEKLLEISKAKVLLAWRQGVKQGDPAQLVGYLIGAPYKNYPKDDPDFALTSKDVTTAEGKVLPLPDDKTWMFDTFAVAVQQRGVQIGKTLFELMLGELVASPYDKLATFAVNHPLSKTREILYAYPSLKAIRGKGGLTEGLVPYRGITAYYMLFDLKSAGPFKLV